MSAPIRPPTISPDDGDRGRVVDFLRAHVVGPFDGPEEVLTEPPTGRYLMGILYPRDATTADVLVSEQVDGTGGEAPSDEVSEDPLTLANAYLPASLGLTFFVAGDAGVYCRVAGARYTPEVAGRRKAWRRSACVKAHPAGSTHANEAEVVLMRPTAEGRHACQTVLAGRAELRAHWRPLHGGHLVTVSLVNASRQSDPDGAPPVEDCLFQVQLACAAAGGRILEYPSVDFLSRDPEDEELRLLHREARAFAIGHGCAADWELAEDGKAAMEVRAEVLPTFVVPAVTQSGRATGDVLRVGWLADPDRAPSELSASLGALVLAYEDWIRSLPSLPEHRDLPTVLHAARDRILERLRLTARRMRDGVALVESDPEVREAFRLANLAMLMQMHHAGKGVGGARRRRGDAPPPPVGDYLALEHRWYPFQLAFALLTLPSLAREDAEDRAVVDLLWFPTGGGKTEAYLLLTAFLIFLRRLRHKDRGAGTAVITRYTLRLLTAQQFQRAATLLCACELLRRNDPARFGDEPITMGLWVGGDVSPNTLEKAAELLEELLDEADPVNKFQLEQCPWCGTEIVPAERIDDRDAYGIRVENASFRMHCTSSMCAFHDRLPVSVVDEDLYLRAPTVLLATVDKFARLAWEERGKAFFGGDRYEPPALIIQDEMHLLSGPLGTTVGVYEAAIEGLIAGAGARPKIIASTATIRRADEQVRALFGRPVRLFPPPGLCAGDSFFAQVDHTAPGRRYMGVMSQGHTPHTTIVHTAAALLQAPVELGLTGAAKDAYWTLVAYHNSLRELGRTATLARDDIPARVPNIARDESVTRLLEDHLVEELQGSVNARELPSKLYRLGLPADREDAVAVLATTNMLSVGVDIPRLGLMLMVGQPKTTSEYIQASSRVGRARNGPGGLVIAMYVATKPRDRSHYEGFRPYHAALYRHVEPTSVTPYSLPSRERALHAALVLLVRHGVPGLAANESAGRFRRDLPGVPEAVDSLVTRIRSIDQDEAAAAERHLERLLDEWEELAAGAAAARKPLFYSASTRQHHSLLRQFGEKGAGWQTLNSMRNVDRQCAVTVLGER